MFVCRLLESEPDPRQAAAAVRRQAWRWFQLRVSSSRVCDAGTLQRHPGCTVRPHVTGGSQQSPARHSAAHQRRTDCRIGSHEPRGH